MKKTSLMRELALPLAGLALLCAGIGYLIAHPGWLVRPWKEWATQIKSSAEKGNRIRAEVQRRDAEYRREYQESASKAAALRAAEIHRLHPIGPGRIAYQSNCEGKWQIFKVHTDGSGLRNLTAHPSDNQDPCWSPDGTEIVFVSNREGATRHDMYVMKAEGGDPRKLPTGEWFWYFHPSWSPDGKRIVFERLSKLDVTSSPSIGLIDSRGEAETLLLPLKSTWNAGERYYNPHPSWSPDGRRIVFSAMHERQWTIHVMDADGKNPRILTSQAGSEDLGPVWSPDGSQIVFMSRTRGQFEIGIVNADGSGRASLTSNSSYDNVHPCWAPDGKHLAFATSRDGNFEIYVADADGSAPTRLTYSRCDNLWPSWAPR